MSIVTLTTAFAPSPSCLASNNFWAGQQENSSKDLWIQLGPPLEQAPACYPESYAPAADVFFPSSSCPSGYTAACASTTATAAAVRSIQVCCPSAFTFVCGGEQPDAAEQYRQSPWLSSFGCWSSMPSTQAFTSLFVARSQSIETIATQIAGIVGAFAIQVQTELGDGPTTKATSEGPGSTSLTTPTQTGALVTMTKGPHHSKPNNHPGSFPSGVAIGVAISCAFALLLTAMLCWTFNSAARKRRAEKAARKFDYASDQLSYVSKGNDESTIATPKAAVERPETVAEKGERPPSRGDGAFLTRPYESR